MTGGVGHKGEREANGRQERKRTFKVKPEIRKRPLKLHASLTVNTRDGLSRGNTGRKILRELKSYNELKI